MGDKHMGLILDRIAKDMGLDETPDNFKPARGMEHEVILWLGEQVKDTTTSVKCWGEKPTETRRTVIKFGHIVRGESDSDFLHVWCDDPIEMTFARLCPGDIHVIVGPDGPVPYKHEGCDEILVIAVQKPVKGPYGRHSVAVVPVAHAVKHYRELEEKKAGNE